MAMQIESLWNGLRYGGVPLSGGHIYTYESGESIIPKTCWHDADGIVEATNPIILDNEGKALVFGAGKYRLVVEDRDGTLIEILDGLEYESEVSGGGGVTDHGELTGLEDNDHPQYQLPSGITNQAMVYSTAGWTATDNLKINPDSIEVGNGKMFIGQDAFWGSNCLVLKDMRGTHYIYMAETLSGNLVMQGENGIYFIVKAGAGSGDMGSMSPLFIDMNGINLNRHGTTEGGLLCFKEVAAPPPIPSPTYGNIYVRAGKPRYKNTADVEYDLTATIGTDIGFEGSLGGSYIIGNTQTLIQFDTVHTDTHGGWDNGTHRYICPVAGWYIITTGVDLYRITDGPYTGKVSIKDNLTTAYLGQQSGYTPNGNVRISTSVVRQLSVGDQIAIFAQSDGSDTNVMGGRDTYVHIHAKV